MELAVTFDPELIGAALGAAFGAVVTGASRPARAAAAKK